MHFPVNIKHLGEPVTRYDVIVHLLVLGPGNTAISLVFVYHELNLLQELIMQYIVTAHLLVSNQCKSCYFPFIWFAVFMMYHVFMSAHIKPSLDLRISVYNQSLDTSQTLFLGKSLHLPMIALLDNLNSYLSLVSL